MIQLRVKKKYFSHDCDIILWKLKGMRFKSLIPSLQKTLYDSIINTNRLMQVREKVTLNYEDLGRDINIKCGERRDISRWAVGTCSFHSSLGIYELSDVSLFNILCVLKYGWKYLLLRTENSKKWSYVYFILLQLWRMISCSLQKVPYFLIDNAHLMYKAHPKLFRNSFWCIDNAHDAN
jgi:hypothetical protein